MKFNVGDHVVGNKKSFYSITKRGWCGEVVRVDKDQIHVKAFPGSDGGNTVFPVDPACFDLVKSHDRHKIVVTSDGATTTARLYAGKTVLKSAEAKCSPRDEFNFETGAALAVDRLLGRETEKEPTKLFPLEDIKAGYLLEVRDSLGREYFMTVVPGGKTGELGCCSNEDWWPVARFGESLDYNGRQIVAVYGYTCNMALLKNSPSDRDLLWSRS